MPPRTRTSSTGNGRVEVLIERVENLCRVVEQSNDNFDELKKDFAGHCKESAERDKQIALLSQSMTIVNKLASDNRTELETIWKRSGAYDLAVAVFAAVGSVLAAVFKGNN